MSKLFNKLELSIESIDFQKSAFGQELEAAFQSLIDSKISEDEYQTSEFKSLIQAIVFKRTGLKISLHLKTDCDGVFLPTFHQNHIFYSNLYKDVKNDTHAIDMLKKISQIKDKHTVNIKTAKVTGIFSELINEVHIDFFMANKIKKYTAGQVTAVLLHEIGHIFTFFEYITRQHSTNQVLASVMKSVINKENIKEKEIVFEEAGNILCGSKDSFNELVNQEDNRIIISTIFKKNFEFVESELGITNYDITTCEQLADQFVSRFGYGRQLIEGLDIDHTKFYNSKEKSKSSMYVASFTQISATAMFLSFTTLSVIFSNPVVIAIWGMLTVVSFISNVNSAGASSKSYYYDILKTRYLRLKEDLVQQLKNKKLDPKEVSLIIDSLKQIDSIIENTYEARTSLDKMVDYIFSKDKSIRASVELQRNLEALAMNDFFVKSAQLKAI